MTTLNTKQLATLLKNVNWQRLFKIGIQLLADKKVAGLIILMMFTMYGIGWDTVLRPNLEGLKQRDEAIAQQKAAIDANKTLDQQYEMWERQLKDLKATMVPIPDGNSANILAVSEAASLSDMATGKKRDTEVLPELIPPHNERKDVKLTTIGSEKLNLLEVPGIQVQTPAAEGAGASTATLPVEQYNYQVTMSGTYPAIVDFLNQLVTYEHLVQIRQITITKAKTDIPEPDPSTFADYPVPLMLNMSFSVFFYDAPGS